MKFKRYYNSFQEIQNYNDAFSHTNKEIFLVWNKWEV
jgi:hypothetical protein